MTISLRKPSSGTTLSRVTVTASGADARNGLSLLAIARGADERLNDRSTFISRDSPESVDGSLKLTAEEASQNASSFELIVIDLFRMPSTIGEIALCLSLDTDKVQGGYESSRRSAIQVCDGVSGVEIAKCALELTAGAPAWEIGKLVRAHGQWRYVTTDRAYHDLPPGMTRRDASAPPPFAGEPRATSPANSSPPAGGPEMQFLSVIGAQHPLGYCESPERQNLIGQGVRLGMDRERAEAMLDLELERLGVANEAALLTRLDAVLRRFTDQDRKLDDKERRDAMQLACRAANGFGQGLRHDVADRYVTQFCRERGVKVKIGLLRWAVP